MEAKLIKTKTGFYLWRNPLDKSQELLGATVPIMNDNGVDLREHILSLKNCQEIELGYDLDELAEKLICVPKIEYDESDLRVYNAVHYGFIKALEILGDKKFSEEELRTAYNVGYTDGKDGATFYNRFIQSLQQTEWDVEIVEEDSKVVESHVWDGSNDGELTWKKQPLFDTEGCLILKRK
jgi:hypothetical protein